MPVWITLLWSFPGCGLIGFVTGFTLARGEWPWTSVRKRLARRRQLSETTVTIGE